DVLFRLCLALEESRNFSPLIVRHGRSVLMRRRSPGTHLGRPDPTTVGLGKLRPVLLAYLPAFLVIADVSRSALPLQVLRSLVEHVAVLVGGVKATAPTVIVCNRAASVDLRTDKDVFANAVRAAGPADPGASAVGLAVKRTEPVARPQIAQRLPGLAVRQQDK